MLLLRGFPDPDKPPPCSETSMIIGQVLQGKCSCPHQHWDKRCSISCKIPTHVEVMLPGMAGGRARGHTLIPLFLLDFLSRVPPYFLLLVLKCLI